MRKEMVLCLVSSALEYKTECGKIVQAGGQGLT